MPFADLALARRLERPEALAGASFIEARQRVQPESAACWMEQNGLRAMFDGPDSPVTQTFGLGLFAELTAGDLNEIERFFLERCAPVNHEVSPFAGIPVADLLARRGYRPIEFTSVLYMPIEACPMDPPQLSVRPIRPGEEDLWYRTSAPGWNQAP